MALCCIAYTTDANYLFPTLVSAIGARRNASAKKADVVIFCLDLDRATELAFGSICRREGVILTHVSPALVEGANAMMARLFLTRFVPVAYQQYLYLDGDVLIADSPNHDSLDPLLEAEVPAGSFLAANDPFTFLLEDDTRQSRTLQAHLREVGIAAEQTRSYFNTGVLRIAREGWEQIGERAWECYARNTIPSRFPDQDAMNIAACAHHLPMSLRWNYPVFLNNAGLAKAIQPRIVHFMSSPKPWDGCFAPWTQAACEPYRALLRTYPQIAKYTRPFSIRKRIKYTLQQRAKQIAETLSWRYGPRRERILAYERACAGPGQLPRNGPHLPMHTAN